MATRALAHAARVAIQEGQSHTAITWLETAGNYLQQEVDSHESAYDLLLIGRLYEQLSEANAVLKPKAFAAFQDARSMAERLRDQRALAYAWGYLGHLYEQDQRYEEALVLTRRAIVVAQHVDVPESLYQWEWQRGRLLLALGQETIAMAAYARALETVQAIRTTLRRGQSSANASFRDVLGPLYFQYVDLLLQKAAALDVSKAAYAYPAVCALSAASAHDH